MVPGRAVFFQPLLAPAVPSVQPHSSVGPAKEEGLLGIWVGALQPCGKSDNLRGGRWIALPAPSCVPCSCLDGRRRREQGTQRPAPAPTMVLNGRSIAHPYHSTCRHL